MKVEETHLKGCYIIQPKVFEDARGHFFESFNKQAFYEKTEIDFKSVQNNQSLSHKNVLRGLHLQNGPHAQAKLVSVIKGSVWDVCVDLRPESKTFGEHFAIELSESNKTQLFIPRGFAHGFVTLEDHTIFSYLCDNYYHQPSESGILYNDADLQIQWPGDPNTFKVSEKDLKLPTFKAFLSEREA